MMKLLLVTLLIAILALKESSQNVAQFGFMIRHTTNENPLKFNGHGNWCGRGGGGRIKDNLDRCCYYHDKCWINLERGLCKGRNLLFVTYRWRKSSNRRISCLNSWWGSSKSKKCMKALCNCDKVAAYCFRTWKHLLG